jgi:acetyl esterase/lipase
VRLRLLVLIATLSCSSTGPGEKLGPNESIPIQRSCPDPSVVAPSDVNLALDVVYSTPDAQPQQLDVAWPKTAGPHPLVVLVHGGSWSGGSKFAHRAEILDFASRGYTAASVNYRLTAAPKNIFPAAVRDVRCAVRWLRSNAATYDLNPNAIAVAGFSAGGHLASMAGVAGASTELDGECDAPVPLPSVNAVISYAGPQDLRVSGPYTEAQAEIVTNFLGVFPGDSPTLAALASPIAHVDASDPPFLLIHGTSDGLVPFEQSRRMRLALQNAGAKATLVALENLTHAYVGLGTSQREDVRCTSVAFLEHWLN